MKPSIILIGKPEWAEKLEGQLPDYDLYQQNTAQGYMTTLIESQPALIIVNASIKEWSRWVSTPKVSPATRRIPLMLISDQPDIRADAVLHGADLALAPQEFLANPGQIIQDHARSPDPQLMEQLDCECQEMLPELAQEGIKKFNAGQYYKQHDLFEAQWMKTEGPVRDLYRAVLQVGVAYYQIQRGNFRGALKMLQRSVQWLLILPDVCQGINIKKLREDSFRVRAELERLGEAHFAEFDMRLIKGLAWVESDQAK